MSGCAGGRRELRVVLYLRGRVAGRGETGEAGCGGVGLRGDVGWGGRGGLAAAVWN